MRHARKITTLSNFSKSNHYNCKIVMQIMFFSNLIIVSIKMFTYVVQIFLMVKTTLSGIFVLSN